MMTDDRLAAIRRRDNTPPEPSFSEFSAWAYEASNDRRALLAEVDRLRAIVTGAATQGGMPGPSPSLPASHKASRWFVGPRPWPTAEVAERLGLAPAELEASCRDVRRAIENPML